jgi:hypothetical protein
MHDIVLIGLQALSRVSDLMISDTFVENRKSLKFVFRTTEYN